MPKGGKQPGAGRPAGIPNKATQNARESIAAFVEGNVGRLNELLDRIAEDNPKAAFDCIMGICEYHIPKLNRTDIQTLDRNGKPSDGFTVTVRHIKPDA